MSQSQTIAFLGGGNMARSLIGGLVADGHPPGDIVVADPDASQTRALEAQFGARQAVSNADAVAQADCVILAVKPQVAGAVAREIATALEGSQALLVSIAAGIRLDSLRTWLNGYDKLVRVMPNTPALVREGASGLYADDTVNQTDRDRAAAVLGAVGEVRWVAEESMIDVVTGVSGSGPAYFFYLMENMQAAAMAAGMDADNARALVLQTALGAAKLAADEKTDFAELRRRVTSPAGTTERAIGVFEAADCGKIIIQAVNAATERAGELADELGA